MTAKVLTLPAIPSMDRNQVQADLYRAESILRQAGLNLRAYYGASDSGDPWVTFCDPETGDVIVHVELIDGEPLAQSRAFVSPAKSGEIAASVRRVLQVLKRQPRSSHGLHMLLAVAVAMAALHVADADAEGGRWQPFDFEDITASALLDSVAVVTVLERVAKAAADAVHEIADSLMGSGKGTEEIQPVDLPGDHREPALTITVAEWETPEMLSLAANDATPAGVIEPHVMVPSPLPVADAYAVQIASEAAVDRIQIPQHQPVDMAESNPFHREALVPVHVDYDQLSAMLVRFRDDSEFFQITEASGMTLVAYGHGSREAHHLIATDGSEIFLIGTESGVNNEAYL